MYSISDLSKISGLTISNLRTRLEKASKFGVNCVRVDGFVFINEKNAKLLTSGKFQQKFSYLLFIDFIERNPNLSIDEVYVILGIDENYVFDELEFVFESKLNYKTLTEL
jgi:hypothetical protein